MLISIGAPFLDVSSSNEKCEYLNLSKLSKFSKLLWKANSLAKREQGLVRSSCFILVLKHSDWHSLKGSWFLRNKENICLLQRIWWEDWRICHARNIQIVHFYIVFCSPATNSCTATKHFTIKVALRNFLFYLFTFSLFKLIKLNSPRPFFLSSSVATKKSMYLNAGLMQFNFMFTYFYP